ncbi:MULTISPECIES: SIR2 family protein [Streptomyces]|uniref:SIR2 family protein n=1 Tax=Streptomyces TaxID=1883 RepID=UPI00099851D7|nr:MULTISPECIES: SIR2 family protein [Streptomyces]MZD19171.1 hypothetical protein [Streptomyces sp. SID5476]
MSSLHFDSTVQAKLKEFADQASDLLGVLVGAGPSIAVGLPTWPVLVARLLALTGVTRDETAARDLMLSGQDVLLATEIALRSSPGNLKDILYEATYGTKDSDEAVRKFEPGPLHHELAEVATERGPGRVSLLTLNVDDLLEDALHQHHGVRFYSRDTARPRAPEGFYEIHHLHGLLSRDGTRKSDNFVFSLSHYNKLLQSRTAWQLSEFNQCLQRGPLLLVGTSYGDVDVRCWLDELYRADPTGLYGVYALLSRQGLRLTPAQFNRAKSFVRDRWSGSILLDCYADVTQALREVRHIEDVDYKPPMERIAEHWKAMESNFSLWQSHDAEKLESDYRGKLAGLLGKRSNVALWVVDSRGKLVRWAVSEKQYRAIAGLKRVPLTPESEFLAARAVCNDEFVGWAAHRGGSISSHWKSIVARPVYVHFPGGPRISLGAISAASATKISDAHTDAVSDELIDLAQAWGVRLAERFKGAPV